MLDVGGVRLVTPQVWPGVSAWMGLFPAPEPVVRQVLPSQALHPVTWPGGRALVAVLASRQPLFPVRRENGSVHLGAPLGAVLVGPLVGLGHRPRPWSLAQLGRPGSSLGVLQWFLPLTSRPGRDAGRQEWGEPKFLADLTFRENREDRSVTVAEDGRLVLGLQTVRPGVLRPYAASLYHYTCTEDRLFRFRIDTRGWRHLRLRPGAATLTFGHHPVADLLRALGVATRGIAAMTIVDDYELEHAAEDLGPARRVLPPYLGLDRISGELVGDYPDTGPIDLLAGLSEEHKRLSVPAGPSTHGTPLHRVSR